MKMTRRDFLNVSTAAAVVCAATLLPVEKAAAAQQTLAAQNLLEQAYLYAFPLVIMDATRTASTNTRTATSNKAPINQFIHAEKLADATTRVVVTPNVDTIYTQAFLDVGAEPMIYGVPQTDRFFNVQVLDAWTNTAAVLETPGLYAITRADWQGELPEGVQRIDVPTTMVWTIARIVLSGQEDLPNVRAIQDKMQLMPLSAYQAGGWTAPAGSYDPANDFVPVKHVLAMDAKEFFDTANQLMETNPPAAADAPVLRELAALHVGPGEKFDDKALGLFSGLRWKLMLLQLKKKLQSESEFYTRQMGQWIYFGDPIGNFGTAYTYRTMVALRGLGANTTDVAIYPKTDVDSTGTVLTGKKTYTLHIEADPPTLEKGFWSVTAYGESDFLIENPIDRYCVIINGCDNPFHPTQALADMLTLYEKLGRFETKVLYIGAKNNTYNSLSEIVTKLGGTMYGLTPFSQVMAVGQDFYDDLKKTGYYIELPTDISQDELKKVVADVDCVYTDTWVDMEFFTNPAYAEKKESIINMMMPYQINADLMAGTDTMVFHDMPIHPGFEITQDVMDKHLETILDEAENRRHAEKGLLVYLITGKLDW